MQPAPPPGGASTQPQPGDVLLGKYRVEKVIGVGGMGAVVSARHLQLDERVAIKFLLPEMLKHDEVVQRFLREARSAIKIRSEHCVRVLDVGTLETGAPYMVMEYLEGQDLAAIVEGRGPLPIPDVVDWTLQACEAIAEAHVIGIVHRDIKPANLFLTRRADGTPSVKVLDFGISKQAASGADAGVTKTQAVLGSPRYMSPEQMRSTKDVDARADVWALGAVVHELVAGAPPFDAETMTALCAAILQDPPRPIRATRPDVPPPFENALRGALEKDRDRRYQNVAQLAAALAPFGSPVARASAERIARVLGVSPQMPVGLQGTGSGVYGPPPMAATTGRSGVVTADVPRSSGKGAAIAAGVIAVLVFAAAGTAGVVLLQRRSASPPSAQGASNAPGSALPAPPVAPPAPSPAAPLPLPTAVLAEPSATPPALASASAAPALRAAPSPAPTVPAVSPGIVPVRRPAATPPPQKPPSNANPFGDDRRG